jgi:ribonuclease VapC
MVVDTSALVAVAIGEEWAEEIAWCLTESVDRLISAASLVELGMVLGRFAPDVERAVRDIVRRTQLTVVDVSQGHASAALLAWQTYGRGRHPERLNYGDCFTYATAAVEGLPVLCTGDDFSRTDIPVVDLSRFRS